MRLIRRLEFQGHLSGPSIPQNTRAVGNTGERLVTKLSRQRSAECHEMFIISGVRELW